MSTKKTSTPSTNGNHAKKDKNKSTLSSLRIASLLPSTTDICISLRLESRIVGITHECDFPSSSHPLYLSASPLIVDAGASGSEGSGHPNGGIICSDDDDDDDDISDGKTKKLSKPLTLTVSQIDPHLQSQAEIDAAVKSSVHNGISLYNLNDSSLADARPTIILTQSLCDVCAVATSDVNNEVAACNFRPGQCRVLSLEPESLEEVAETFVTVAEACGAKERGIELSRKFWQGIDRISHATTSSLSESKKKRPTVLFFEWLDPPFDAGHWIPDMLERSNCASPLPHSSKNTRKSIQLDWERVYECDPDAIIVGCCGFDLTRNAEDAVAARGKFAPLRAFRNGRIFAADGNLYFARPGPGLREGVALLARCAYDGEEEVVEKLEELDFLPREGEGWSRVVFPEGGGGAKSGARRSSSSDNNIPDVEDLIDESYSKIHEEACRAEMDFYKDPKTGYNVYTEHAHKKRGKCCGSGCRHCPYNHVNVKDKLMRIQQPAFLYEGPTDDGDDSGEDALFASLDSIPSRSHVKVLFFSGGKDSFLAIRRLVKERQRQASPPFHLILLTTFDAKSRIIAHQEVPIDTVLRQAQHLQIPLLAIPLHRGSGETYPSRIEKGMDAIRKRLSDARRVSLVFGDLHLDHIREWREKELSSERHALEYPLWEVPYEGLMEDLEASGIGVTLSAVTKGGLRVGTTFDRSLWKEAVRLGMDGFGEEGEFHSVAEVWAVSREQALGL